MEETTTVAAQADDPRRRGGRRRVARHRLARDQRRALGVARGAGRGGGSDPASPATPPTTPLGASRPAAPDSLAFLLTEPQHLLFADPTFALLLRGAAEALAQRSMTLVLLVAGTPAERAERRALRQRRARRRRAAHLVARVRPAAGRRCSQPASRPCAAAYRSATRATSPTVSVDEVGSARDDDPVPARAGATDASR